MITAIPLGRNGVSRHLAKADAFMIQAMADDKPIQFDNPAKQAGCGGKTELLNQLQAHKVERVLVSNIGSRMLARLLDAGIRVFQIAGGTKEDNLQVLMQMDTHVELTDASQGGATPNFTRKQAEGKGKCCSHGHSHNHGEHKRHSFIMNKDHQGCSGKGHCCGKHH